MPDCFVCLQPIQDLTRVFKCFLCSLFACKNCSNNIECFWLEIDDNDECICNTCNEDRLANVFVKNITLKK
jgi:hypothetical protein